MRDDCEDKEDMICAKAQERLDKELDRRIASLCEKPDAKKRALRFDRAVGFFSAGFIAAAIFMLPQEYWGWVLGGVLAFCILASVALRIYVAKKDKEMGFK